jgi:hypothetical protein
MEGVFHQNDRQPAIAFSQGFAEPFGRRSGSIRTAAWPAW